MKAWCFYVILLSSESSGPAVGVTTNILLYSYMTKIIRTWYNCQVENKEPARRSDLWMEFVNSDRHDYLGTGEWLDSLDDPKWLDDFLKRWGLETRPVPRRRLLPALRKLRLILQNRAEAITQGQHIKDLDLRGLNDRLMRFPLIRRLEVGRGGARVRLVPVRPSEISILAEIVSSFAETLADGDISRLKVCGNRDCRWIFSDASKNQTRRWCGPTCGNLMKVRRFRRRRKVASRGKLRARAVSA